MLPMCLHLYLAASLLETMHHTEEHVSCKKSLRSSWKESCLIGIAQSKDGPERSMLQEEASFKPSTLIFKTIKQETMGELLLEALTHG